MPFEIFYYILTRIKKKRQRNRVIKRREQKHFTFLAPHSSPNLYTYNTLSLCPTANFVESGLNANPLITYDFLPALESAGFVENLSRRLPSPSNNKMCLSDVATANFSLLGDHAK